MFSFSQPPLQAWRKLKPGSTTHWANEAAKEHKADAIGMSGLLVKSTVVMKENLELMSSRGIETPVICGGAALNRAYVEQDLGTAYGKGRCALLTAHQGGRPSLSPSHRPFPRTRP